MFDNSPSHEMDENLSRGYIQLGKGRGNDFRFSKEFRHLSPPVDKFNAIYLSLVLAGVGFLLPYNSFIIAVDYFGAQYPDTTIVFDMSLMYIGTAIFAVFANNFVVETFSLNTRITFGYIVSFFTLLFVATCEIWWGIFGTSTLYTMNLVAVSVVALGCTVQQSSFYGYTSMLPSRYTQAVMAGESGAGLLVSINRILTKLLLDDGRLNTLIFFSISAVLVSLCFALHQAVQKTDFVQFYLTLCRESKKITLEPTEDAGLMDPVEPGGEGGKSQYGVLKLQQSPLDSAGPGTVGGVGGGSHFSFANPVYEPTATTAPGTGPTYKVEDVVVRMHGAGATSTSYRRTNSTRLWAAIKKGMAARMEVTRSVWQYMLSIALAYFVTLCLYPGIESDIHSCRFGSWMPVIIMAAFNAADLLGKMLASVTYEWSRGELLMFAGVRALLIPLLVLCAIPRQAPIISSEEAPILISIMLGLTNGLVGSLPMILAPARVPDHHRELTGNMMTLSYNVGLTAGSLVAYLLDGLINMYTTVPYRQICTELVTSAAAATTAATELANLTTTAVTTATTSSVVLTTTTTQLTTTAAAAVSSILMTSVTPVPSGDYNSTFF
ncbi:equilibrative nucleoside transporter 4 [Nilaparvata lugens]|uniref:equilibrative nucleoside transporter 4 n=1 Tax=Nilaparvata lugens TaxID=108931 RepID=UPI00193E2A8B|nr:equilibrative nucleoside transporter 4 [Nilaparvata lugens]